MADFRSCLHAPQFLINVLAPSRSPLTRPKVTLTFAQSLDAKIAGREGRQLILSGKESMVMTHWMRTMHDAILVGIGTALNDDPQLNTRHLPPRTPDTTQSEHNRPYHLPRPVILDSRLRLSPECKLLKNYQKGQGRRPWVICADPESTSEPIVNHSEWLARFNSLEGAGARMLKVPIINGLLSIPATLNALNELGIRSLMVEGGARVIGSFFAEAGSSGTGEGIIDTLIVTVAPTLVGVDGIGYGVKIEEATTLKHVSTQTLGKDTVMVMATAGDIAQEYY